MKIRSLSFRVLVALVALPISAQAAGHSKLDRALRTAAQQPHPGVQRVIIQAPSESARAALKRALLAHGDIVEADHPGLNGLTVQLHGEDLAALDLDPNVSVISSDAEVSATSFGSGGDGRTGPVVTPVLVSDSLRASLGSDNVRYTGAGIGVALIDSGIDPNPDVAEAIKGFWDFTRNGIHTLPYDDYGHGTHLAGLIASNGRASRGQFVGVAPGVRLFGFKVLDKNGRGRSSDVLRAIGFVIANREYLGIDVINLSLGHPILESAATDPLVRAVEAAEHAGIVVVVAAGNVGTNQAGVIGYAGVTSPGNAPSVITVGAVDTHDTPAHRDDRVAWFSSRGPTWYDGYAKPDVVAPGVGLVSDAPVRATLYTTYPQLLITANGHKFGVLSGTSMATAVTTGVVSVMMEASRSANQDKPSLTPNAIKAILQYTALPMKTDAGAPFDALSQGTGEVNVIGASALASAIDTSIPTGHPWVAHRLPAVTRIGGENVAWSQNIVWGTRLITGSNIVWSSSAFFDENIVWGTSVGCNMDSASCENIVWGTSEVENIVWGTNIVWASNVVWGTQVVGLRLANKNIVWGTTSDGGENIVWGTLNFENIVWGTLGGDGTENIVWGTLVPSDDSENMLWARAARGDDENIVWGTLRRAAAVKGGR